MLNRNWFKAKGASTNCPRTVYANAVVICVVVVQTILKTRGDTGVVVFLGGEGGKQWFLMVMGGEGDEPVAGRKREDLLFLAGECAGLLFLRDFAEGAP